MSHTIKIWKRIIEPRLRDSAEIGIQLPHFIPNNFNRGDIAYFLPQNNSKFCYNIEIAWARDNRFRTVLFIYLRAIVRMQLSFSLAQTVVT